MEDPKLYPYPLVEGPPQFLFRSSGLHRVLFYPKEKSILPPPQVRVAPIGTRQYLLFHPSCTSSFLVISVSVFGLWYRSLSSCHFSSLVLILTRGGITQSVTPVSSFWERRKYLEGWNGQTCRNVCSLVA